MPGQGLGFKGLGNEGAPFSSRSLLQYVLLSLVRATDIPLFTTVGSPVVKEHPACVNVSFLSLSEQSRWDVGSLEAAGRMLFGCQRASNPEQYL